MTYVSNPFVRYYCAKCKQEIERQISPNRTSQELSDLRDGPPLVCAECYAGLETRVA